MSVEQDIVSKAGKYFLEKSGPDIHKTLIKDEFLLALMKLRQSFPLTDLSQHFGIYLVVFVPKLFIHE